MIDHHLKRQPLRKNAEFFTVGRTDQQMQILPAFQLFFLRGQSEALFMLLFLAAKVISQPFMTGADALLQFSKRTAHLLLLCL